MAEDRTADEPLTYEQATPQQRAEVRGRVKAKLAEAERRRSRPGYWDDLMARVGIRVDPAA